MATERLVVTAFGRCVALEVPRELADQARLRLPPGAVAAPGPEGVPGPEGAPGPVERTWQLAAADGGWQATRDGESCAGGPEPLPVLELLTGDLELWVAEHAQGLIFVHAGAVAWRGRAIVIPGRTRAGKSTLVAALVRAGAGYLSDEYAVIAADGVVHPYPRPLALRGNDGQSPQRMPVEELGGTVSPPVPLGLVAQLVYDPDQGWTTRELSPAQTLLALMDNTVPARTRPLEVMDHLQAAVRKTTGLSGYRGNSEMATSQLLNLLPWS